MLRPGSSLRFLLMLLSSPSCYCGWNLKSALETAKESDNEAVIKSMEQSNPALRGKIVGVKRDADGELEYFSSRDEQVVTKST